MHAPAKTNPWSSAVFLLGLGCATTPTPLPAPLPAPSAPPPLHERIEALGHGIQFRNTPTPDNATTPEVGAGYVYARAFSANSRNSPVGIEVWLFNEAGSPIHGEHGEYLHRLYREIYGWDPGAWKRMLGDGEDAASVLQQKSDMFWESLSQHVAERVFNDGVTPPVFRHGPQCIVPSPPECHDDGISEAHQVVVRTFLDASRDPMNPVTRSITYIARRGSITDPELYFELQVPNGVRVAGPNQETLDFRPVIAGQHDAIHEIHLWAHLPNGRTTRSTNPDYPDYNLIFVPLRHLVLQGEVDDPQQPASGKTYPDASSLIGSTKALVDQLRTPEGGRAVVDQLHPFLTPKYYYMFEAGGQGITDYRNYILGDTAGIARGLDPDFGRLELLIDGVRVAAFEDTVE